MPAPSCLPHATSRYHNAFSSACISPPTIRTYTLSQHNATSRPSRSCCRCMATETGTRNYTTNGAALQDSNARLGTDRDGTMGPQTSFPSGARGNLSSSTPRPPITPPVTPVVIRSYRVSLWDAMKFNGPAPEIINGRLAMIGILVAAANETKYSETVLQQFQHTPFRTLLLTAVVVYSSLTPILKGAKSEAFGIFTPKAEITNSRAAMLGFAALLLLEDKSKVPFF